MLSFLPSRTSARAIAAASLAPSLFAFGSPHKTDGWTPARVTAALDAFFASTSPEVRIPDGIDISDQRQIPDGVHKRLVLGPNTRPYMTDGKVVPLDYYALPRSVTAVTSLSTQTGVTGFDDPAGDDPTGTLQKNIVARVTLAAPITAKKGDIACIIADDEIPYAKHNSPTSRARLKEFVEILAVGDAQSGTSNLIDLTAPLTEREAAYTTNVRFVVFPDASVDIIGGCGDYADATVADGAKPNLPLIRLRGLRAPEIHSFRCRRASSAAINLVSCYMAKVLNPDVRNGLNESNLNHFSYAVVDYGSYGSQITGVSATNFRHGYTGSTYPLAANGVGVDVWKYGVTRGTILSGGQAFGCSNGGFNTHDECTDYLITGCVVSNNYLGNSSGGPAYAIRGRNGSVESCKGQGTYAGILISGKRQRVVDAQMRGCQYQALSLLGSTSATYPEDVTAEVAGGVFEVSDFNGAVFTSKPRSMTVTTAATGYAPGDAVVQLAATVPISAAGAEWVQWSSLGVTYNKKIARTSAGDVSITFPSGADSASLPAGTSVKVFWKSIGTLRNCTLKVSGNVAHTKLCEFAGPTDLYLDDVLVDLTDATGVNAETIFYLDDDYYTRLRGKIRIRAGANVVAAIMASAVPSNALADVELEISYEGANDITGATSSNLFNADAAKFPNFRLKGDKRIGVYGAYADSRTAAISATASAGADIRSGRRLDDVVFVYMTSTGDATVGSETIANYRPGQTIIVFNNNNGTTNTGVISSVTPRWKIGPQQGVILKVNRDATNVYPIGGSRRSLVLIQPGSWTIAFPDHLEALFCTTGASAATGTLPATAGVGDKCRLHWKSGAAQAQFAMSGSATYYSKLGAGAGNKVSAVGGEILAECVDNATGLAAVWKITGDVA